MKLFGCEKSNESNELVTFPSMTVPGVPVAVLTPGVTVTVDVFTGGFNASPLLETPTPVTVYSHPVR